MIIAIRNSHVKWRKRNGQLSNFDTITNVILTPKQHYY